MTSPPRTPAASTRSDRPTGAWTPTPEADKPAATDGRQLRRERNREAVVEALLDLYAEGNLRPNAEEIAARSGLSPRSLFRYFDDVDDLIRSAIDRQLERALPHVPIDATVDAPLAIRIEALIEQRFRLFDAVGNAAAVSRLRAPFEPLFASTLARNREFLRSQMAELFAPELAKTGTDSSGTLAAADVITSFESRHLLIDDQGLSPAKAKAVMAGALSALLGPGG
jgi:AcrR family transcriptional regulator